MPEVKFSNIVSFSSEDKKFPADNLLKPEGTAKWKSGTPGEKSVSIILQLEKPSQLHQIDIGNEGSAFIEVLVGKAAQKETEYQVIVVASSFMNPGESRSGNNSTRVRIFHSDQLSQAVKSDRWDRVKIVCTQPFNKTSTYGLSFVKLHSPPSKDDPAPSAETPKSEKKLGGFTLKSDDDSAIQTGTLFAKKKTEPSPSPLSGAAAARQASRVASDSGASPGGVSGSKSNTTPARQRPSSPFTPKVTPSSSNKKRSKDESDDETESERPKPKIKRSATESSVSSTSSQKTSSIKRSSTVPPRPSSSREFSSLMKKVVFVMSGYQNPERAEIRDEAVEMGATYRPDWGKGCTYLICAFPNTPKYQQVKGKGRIVAADWIRRCYKKKELLPWRKYRVGKAETPPGSSASETEEDEPMETQPSRTPQARNTPSQRDRERDTPREREPKKENKEKEREEPAKKKKTAYTGKGVTFSSGEDTDDEIERVREQNKAAASKPTPSSAAAADADDPYEISTDDEGTNGKEDVTNGGANGGDDTDDDGELPPLPDYFKLKHFYLHGKFSHADRRSLIRYITAYNGVLEDYMSETVKYVITDSKWDDAFDEAISENPDLIFVKPDWVKNVHEKQKFVPYQKFVIVPQ